MTEKQYDELVKEMSPGSPMGKDCVNAFWIGGLICTIGQVFLNWYSGMGLDKDVHPCRGLAWGGWAGEEDCGREPRRPFLFHREK